MYTYKMNAHHNILNRGAIKSNEYKLSRSYPSLTNTLGTVSIVTADGRIIVVSLCPE